MFPKGFPQLGEVVETELRDLERIMEKEYAQDESLASAPACHGECGPASAENGDHAETGRQFECQPCSEVGLVYEDVDSSVLSAEDVVRVKAALDSGACRSCLGPDDLPAGVEPSGNPTGASFVGANNSPIKRYGEAITKCRHAKGSFGTTWQVAAVTRPLAAVSQTCGPMDKPGRQEVIFTNQTSYILPPGAAAEIIKKFKPVAEFPREGNLYLAELELSSFAGQGPAR